MFDDPILRALAIFLVGGAIGAVFHLFNLKAVQDSRAAGADQEEARPSRVIAVVYGIIATVFAVLGLTVVSRNPGFIPGYLVAAFGIGSAVTLVSALHESYNVRWNREGVSGPRNVLLPPFYRRRDDIAWREVAKLEETRRGNFILHDNSGRQIMWNRYYTGHKDLRDALARERPDICQTP